MIYMTGWLARLFKPLMKEVPAAKTPLGERGENVAAKYVRHELGYRILTRNFRVKSGEVDIIARDGDTLVFIEVKTRAYDDPTPEEQVNLTKQHQITRAAKVFLSRYGGRPRARFDIVGIVWPTGQKPMIRHTQSAFEATY